MKIDVQQLTDPGPRTENQDEMGWFTLDNGGQLLVVADGMGGAAGGKTAAKIAIASTKEMFEKFVNDKKISDILKMSIEIANERIHHKGTTEPKLKGMGTTIVILYIKDGFAHFAHIGDSRLYLYRANKLLQLTKDHSQVQQMVDDKLISQEAAFDHPDANIISRALGNKPTIDPDIFPKPFKIIPGDRFMLCSDGLCGVLRNQAISQLFHKYQNNPKILCKTFISKSLQEGGSDNITVQIVSFEGKPKLQPDSNIEIPPKVENQPEKKSRPSRMTLFVLVCCVLLMGLIALNTKFTQTDIPPRTGTTPPDQHNKIDSVSESQANTSTTDPTFDETNSKSETPQTITSTVIKIKLNQQNTLEHFLHELSNTYSIKFEQLIQDNNLHKNSKKLKTKIEPTISITIISK